MVNLQFTINTFKMLPFFYISAELEPTKQWRHQHWNVLVVVFVLCVVLLLLLWLFSGGVNHFSRGVILKKSSVLTTLYRKMPVALRFTEIWGERGTNWRETCLSTTRTILCIIDTVSILSSSEIQKRRNLHVHQRSSSSYLPPYQVWSLSRVDSRDL